MWEQSEDRVIVSVVLGLAAMIAVVLVGQFYGAHQAACGEYPVPRFQQRQWPVDAARWGIFGGGSALIVAFGIAFKRDEWQKYLSHPLVWAGWAVVVGGLIGWKIITGRGWTC